MKVVLVEESLEKEFKEVEQRKNYFQVDVLKTIMIFLVIFDHTIPWIPIKNNLGVALWERISIPVFLVIMGFNLGKSFQHNKDKLSNSFYNRDYFWRKFFRFITPFILLYFISTIIGGMFYGFSMDLIQSGQWGTDYEERHLLIGILPFWGPGNWFIPVIFGAIFITPWLYKGFSGSHLKAILTLILCFIIELITQTIIFVLFVDKNPLNLYRFATWSDYYNAIFLIYSIFLLLSAVGFGMWFSRDHNLFSRNNIFVWVVFFISLTYLIAYQFFDYRIMIDSVAFLSGDYNFMVFPYSAFIFLVAMKILPSHSGSKLANVIKTISRSTYHILLTQILYFAIVYALYGDHYGASIFGIDLTYGPIVYINLIINWIICIPIGVYWYQKERLVFQYFKSKIEIEPDPPF